MINSSPFERIKAYLKNYSEVLIFYSDQRDDFLAWLSLALFYSLKDFGKNAIILSQSFEKNVLFLEKNIPQINSSSRHPASFIISINENSGFEISSLSYQKQGQNLNLFLTGQGNLTKDNILLKSNKTEALLICLGAKDLNEIEGLPEKTFLVINLDNQNNNERFGQVNLVQPDYLLAEIVFTLITNLKNELKGKIVLALIFGFLKELFFNQNKITRNQLEKINFLQKQLNFAEKNLLNQWLSVLKDKNEKIYYLALLKTSFQPKDTLWLCLSQADFQQVNVDFMAIPFVLQKLTSVFTATEKAALLWEQNSSPLRVRGIFYLKEKKAQETLVRNFSSQIKNNWILLKTDFKNIKNAKEKISEIFSGLNS